MSSKVTKSSYNATTVSIVVVLVSFSRTLNVIVLKFIFYNFFAQGFISFVVMVFIIGAWFKRKTISHIVFFATFRTNEMDIYFQVSYETNHTILEISGTLESRTATIMSVFFFLKNSRIYYLE